MGDARDEDQLLGDEGLVRGLRGEWGGVGREQHVLERGLRGRLYRAFQNTPLIVAQGSDICDTPELRRAVTRQ